MSSPLLPFPEEHVARAEFAAEAAKSASDIACDKV